VSRAYSDFGKSKDAKGYRFTSMPFPQYVGPLSEPPLTLDRTDAERHKLGEDGRQRSRIYVKRESRMQEHEVATATLSGDEGVLNWCGCCSAPPHARKSRSERRKKKKEKLIMV